MNISYETEFFIQFQNDRMEKQAVIAMTSAPDILAPYLVHFTMKPNAIESVQIYEECLNDIQSDFTILLDSLRCEHEGVSSPNLLSWALSSIQLFSNRFATKSYVWKNT